MQAKKSHIAIIIDEFGGTDGIITMEDILEVSSAKSGMSMMRLYRETRKFRKRILVTGRQASTKVYEELDIGQRNLMSLRSADGSWGSSSACQGKAIISSRMA